MLIMSDVIKKFTTFVPAPLLFSYSFSKIMGNYLICAMAFNDFKKFLIMWRQLLKENK